MKLFLSFLFFSFLILLSSQISLFQDISNNYLEISPSFFSPISSFSSILNTINSLNYSNILFFTRIDDLHSSFGNYLSDYIETRICANLTNLHFYSPLQGNKSFIRDSFPLPRFIYHPNASSIYNKSIDEIKNICPCDRRCHELSNSLIFTHPHHLKDILLPLINSLSNIFPRYIPLNSPTIWRKTIRKPFPLYILPEKDHNVTTSNNSIGFIPSVPDVLIHYRCSDNVQHYRMGIFTFPQFSPPLIPKTVKTIYVLSEPLSRTPPIWFFPPGSCDAILDALHKYLSSNFPYTTVIILRGEPLLHDIYRIYASKLIFCSASTFCYYPALLAPFSNYPPYPTSVLPPTTRVHTPFTGLIRGITSLLPGNQKKSSELTRRFHSHFHDLGQGSVCKKHHIFKNFSNSAFVIKCLMNNCAC